MTHRAGYHCGKTAFEFEGGAGAVLDSKCSLYRKHSGLLHFVPASVFALKMARQNLGIYGFNNQAIGRHFCPACADQTFPEGADAKVNMMVAKNVRCLEGIDAPPLDINIHNGRDQ
jgi:hypothetical protein